MTETKTPLKAIRAKCLDCMCGSAHEVRLCPSADCALHQYRLGHRPGYCHKSKKDAPTPTENGESVEEV